LRLDIFCPQIKNFTKLLEVGTLANQNCGNSQIIQFYFRDLQEFGNLEFKGTFSDEKAASYKRHATLCTLHAVLQVKLSFAADISFN